MAADLLPLVLGAAYACFGLSSLRLARLQGLGRGWTRLCVAGLTAALLEWYSLFSLNFLGQQPNDLAGSLLGLGALGGFVEFARCAIARRYGLGVVAQVAIGLVVAALIVLAAGVSSGGIYDRLLFTQRAVGLLATGAALVLVLPGGHPGAAWTRAAGLFILVGLFGAFALPAVWPLIPAVGGAAVLLRVLYVVRHRGSRGVFAAWNAAEFAAVLLLLVVTALAARESGQQILRLEGGQFLRLTETAATALDPDDVAVLQGQPRDAELAEHRRVSARLLSIQQTVRSATSPDTASRFAYLMAARGPQVVFLADQPPDPAEPVHPGDVYDEASDELRQALIDGLPFVEGPLADRYGVWVSAFAPVRSADGELLALLGIDFDADDWEALEEDARLATILNWLLALVITLSVFTSVGLGLESRQQLRSSEQMFRIAADYTVTWEYWVGPDGTMLHVSPSCEKVTGYKPAAFDRHPRQLLALVDPEDRHRVAEHLRTCARDAPPCEFDFKIRRKDGATTWISHACQSVYDADGRWNGRRASNRDITSLRLAELSLARLERLQRGCQQALRRLLAPGGERYTADALELVGEAGGCSCAAIMRLTPERDLDPVCIWPDGKEAICPVPWEKLRARALPILSVGEAFELLPRETRDDAGPMHGSHIAMLPLLDGRQLRGLVAFAAPPQREPWSRAELAALATVASGIAVALAQGEATDDVKSSSS